MELFLHAGLTRAPARPMRRPSVWVRESSFSPLVCVSAFLCLLVFVFLSFGNECSGSDSSVSLGSLPPYFLVSVSLSLRLWSSFPSLFLLSGPQSVCRPRFVLSLIISAPLSVCLSPLFPSLSLSLLISATLTPLPRPCPPGLAPPAL